jgi:uncharacterized DUF497 family protein
MVGAPDSKKVPRSYQLAGTFLFSRATRPLSLFAEAYAVARFNDQVAFVYTNDYTYYMKISGFDWDSGNWPKCGKHGVSREEIEQVLLGEPAVMPDPCPDEPRMRAIGKTLAGRYVFLVFMMREIYG